MEGGGNVANISHAHLLEEDEFVNLAILVGVMIKVRPKQSLASKTAMKMTMYHIIGKK